MKACVLLTPSPSRAIEHVAAILNCAVGHLVGERMNEKVCHVLCKLSAMLVLRAHLQPIDPC